MYNSQTNAIPEWEELFEQIQSEVAGLGTGERQWLCGRLTNIAEIQKALHELFCKVGGLSACTNCHGECCGCGRHHVTLTTLLAYLLAGELPPAPEFSKTCPFLKESGCVFPVARRPYNCITFFCEQLESNLECVERETLRELDLRLRREYQEIAERYPAASLRGLWISIEQLGEGPILRSKCKSC